MAVVKGPHYPHGRYHCWGEVSRMKNRRTFSQLRKPYPRTSLRMFLYVNMKSPGEMRQKRRPDCAPHRVGNTALDLDCPGMFLGLVFFAF